MSYGYIYQIINIINNHSYIGYTHNLHARLSRHCNDATKIDNPKFKRSLLYRAIRKYGVNNFVVRILETPLICNLQQREKYWIKFFDTKKCGYNLTYGGDGGDTSAIKRKPFSKRAKLNMSLAKIGKQYGSHSKEWNQHIGDGGRGIKKPSLSDTTKK